MGTGHAGLRRIRLTNGLSARQLAAAAGLSPACVVRAEAGNVTPRIARALAAVLGSEVLDALTPPGNAILRARWALGLSRTAAAAMAGVSHDVWSRAEAGRQVHPANAKRIADALGIHIADVIAIPEQESEPVAVP